MTLREKTVLRKAIYVIREYLYDCDGDIEGCDGDQLTEIEHSMAAAQMIERRILNYLTGKVDNPRGVSNGEAAITPTPNI